MLYTIENKSLKISVDTYGAQLQSVFSKDTQTEYLWQGDEKYWSGRAYNLFPAIGRLYTGAYSYQDKDYSFKIHGLARYEEFSLEERTANKLVFKFSSSERTLESYPFEFDLFIRFELNGKTLVCTYNVVNKTDGEMIYAIGGHPGFNVPFEKGTQFEDYYLEFPEKTQTVWHTLSEDKFMSGKVRAYPELKKLKIKLNHEMFNDDAIILGNTCRSVFLKSATGKRYLKFDYPSFRYLGLWHMPNTDAPYVCLEPWTALPSTDGVKDDYSLKLDMTHLAKAEQRESVWSVTIEE